MVTYSDLQVASPYIEKAIASGPASFKASFYLNSWFFTKGLQISVNYDENDASATESFSGYGNATCKSQYISPYYHNMVIVW